MTTTLRLKRLPLALLAIFAACTEGEPARSGGLRAAAARGGALTSAQCDYFGALGNGKVTICHGTASAKKPYQIINVSTASCKDDKAGHAHHVADAQKPGDYIAPPDDPACSGGGCYPEGAPYDGTVVCCEGLAPANGVCADAPCPANASGAPACACNAGFQGTLDWDFSSRSWTGTCAPIACAPGLRRCNGSCVDVTLDDANCGACGNACGAGQGCSSGVCVAMNACLSQFPLYVVERGSGELSSVDEAGDITTVASGLSDPIALWTLPTGHLLVVERGNLSVAGSGRFTEVDPSAPAGSRIVSSAYPGFAANDVFTDNDGTIYAGSYRTGVWRKRVGEAAFSLFSTVPGDLTAIRRIGPYLFVAGIWDYGSSSGTTTNFLYRIDASGAYEPVIGNLYVPLGLEVFKGGLLIMEFNDSRISWLRGVLPGQTPVLTTFATGINLASTIATDCHGHYFVSEQAHIGGITRIGSDGSVSVLVPDTYSPDPPPLWAPRGLAFAQPPCASSCAACTIPADPNACTACNQGVLCGTTCVDSGQCP